VRVTEAMESGNFILDGLLNFRKLFVIAEITKVDHFQSNLERNFN
jgi:hypothetical protein